MSVLQMRVMGCKGILMHDPTLDKEQPDGKIYDVVMRDSQHKFEWNKDTLKYRELQDGAIGRLLGSCTRGESRPFNYGRLNKQYVLILKALGISEQVFLGSFFKLLFPGEKTVSPF